MAAITCLLGLGSLTLFMGGDQANYAYASWAWLDGATLYTDIVVWRPPFNVFINAAAELLFGHSIISIRITDLIWQMATACAIAALVHSRLDHPLAAICAGVAYAVTYYQFSYWNSAQTGGWLSLLLCVAILITQKSTHNKKPKLMTLAGLALGSAFYFKYPALAGILPVCSVLLIRDKSAIHKYLGYACLGFGLLTTLLIVWLIASGAWPSFLDHHLNVLPSYVEYSSSGRNLVGVLVFFGKFYTSHELHYIGVLLVGNICILFGFGVTRYTDLRFAPSRLSNNWTVDHFWLLVIGEVWLVASLVMSFSQGKFFIHHYLPIIAPASTVAAIPVSLVTGRALRGFIAFCLASVVGLNIWVDKPPGYPSFKRFVDVVTTRTSLEDVWAKRKSIAQILQLASWVKQNTAPDDRVYIWGRLPVVNYYTKRKLATRYVTNYQFRRSWRPPSLEDDLMNQLKATKPEFFVISSEDAVPAATGSPKDSKAVFEAFDRLRRWIETNYEQATELERFDIRKRKPSVRNDIKKSKENDD